MPSNKPSKKSGSLGKEKAGGMGQVVRHSDVASDKFKFVDKPLRGPTGKIDTEEFSGPRAGLARKGQYSKGLRAAIRYPIGVDWPG